MNKENFKILQVNTFDSIGGAAKVSWNLFEKYHQQTSYSYLATGIKHSSNPHVFEIPQQYPTNSWEKTWHTLEEKTTKHLVGKIKGAGKLKQFLHYVGQPQNIIPALLGMENFNFSGTKTLLSLPPATPNILHLHNLHGNYFDLRLLPELSNQIPTFITLHDAWLLSGHCAHSLDCEKWKTGCYNCPHLSLYPSLKVDTTKYNWNRKAQIYAKSKLHIATPCQWLMDKVNQSILSKGIITKKVIHNGVDLSIFTPANKFEAKKKLNIPPDTFTILFVGSTDKNCPWKDYPTLEEAMIKLTRLTEQKIILLCLDKEAPTKRLHNIEIQFLPPEKISTKTARLFQAADLYVHPAKAETFPNVILEALACGTPVIATNVGGISEQLTELPQEGANGMLVEKQNSNQLANKILFLLQNKHLLQNMSHHARKTAQQKFDLNMQVTHYLTWYKEVLWQTQSSR